MYLKVLTYMYSTNKMKTTMMMMIKATKVFMYSKRIKKRNVAQTAGRVECLLAFFVKRQFWYKGVVEGSVLTGSTLLSSGSSCLPCILCPLI